MTSRTHLKRKEVDDVMGGEAAWENVDKVPGMYHTFLWRRKANGGRTAVCPKCDYGEAYYRQLQIRR